MMHNFIKPFALPLIALIQFVNLIYNRLDLKTKHFTNAIQIGSIIMIINPIFANTYLQIIFLHKESRLEKSN